MNKKFLICWVLVFVVWMAGSIVVHGVLLHSGYATLPNLFRPEAEAQVYMHILVLAHVVMAGAVVWIYQRGRENKAWLPQGLRFGAAIALLGPVPMYSIYYVVQPMPGAFVVQQIVYEAILLLLLGVIAAFLNKPAAQ
jgi:hypothetical protein